MSTNNRKFSIDTARLFEYASTVATYLQDDIKDFSEFDNTFGESTIDNLQGSISTSLTMKSDNAIRSEQSQLTNDVKVKMKACKEGYKTVSYFVRKVFVDNAAVIEEFGLDDYKKIRDNKERMIMFIRSLAETASQYQEELLTGGINKNVIDSLPNLHQQLFDAKNKRDMLKKQRGKLTKERVILLNHLYGQLLSISNAAKMIYADNPVQLGKYTLPKPHRKKNKL